jgi:hypothetical protein
MSHNDSHPSTLPLRMAPFSALLVFGGVALGVVGIAAAFLLASSPQRAWTALHFNWMFWSSVAIGMVVFSVALHLTHARWAWSVKRFSLAGAAFLPISFVIFPIMMLGGRHVYFHHWLAHDGHNPIHGDPVLEAKAAWLTFPGMLGRDLLALVVLYGLALLFTYHQLRPDMHGLERTGRRGWGNGAADVVAVAEESYRKNLKIGVFTALAFAFGWGLIAIDVGMTTLPHFFSTMFPVAFFISAFHSAIAMTVVMTVLHRRSLRLEEYIGEKQFHDIGKLLFAFAVFWMYINWSQYVVIWYGLLPTEQEYFVRKFTQPFAPLVMAAVMLIFVVPFFGLLPRSIKKMPPILAGFAGLVLVGHWLERFLISTPNFWDAEWGAIGIGLPEILMALGFLGLFVAAYRVFLSRFPVLPSPVSLNAIPNGLVTFARPSRTTVAEV